MLNHALRCRPTSFQWSHSGCACVIRLRLYLSLCRLATLLGDGAHSRSLFAVVQWRSLRLLCTASSSSCPLRSRAEFACLPLLLHACQPRLRHGPRSGRPLVLVQHPLLQHLHAQRGMSVVQRRRSAQALQHRKQCSQTGHRGGGGGRGERGGRGSRGGRSRCCSARRRRRRRLRCALRLRVEGAADASDVPQHARSQTRILQLHRTLQQHHTTTQL